MKPDAIVFDYDGTLIDTIPVKIESYARATIKEFGVDPAKRPVITETQLRLGGAPKFTQLAETLRALGLTATPAQQESWGRRYVAYNDAHTPACPEFPVVRRLLAELGARYDLYLASGIPDDLLQPDVDRRNLRSFFTAVRGGDKAAILRTIQAAGYTTLHFVGDGGYDAIVARDAGIPFFLSQSNADLERILATLR